MAWQPSVFKPHFYIFSYNEQMRKILKKLIENFLLYHTSLTSQILASCFFVVVFFKGICIPISVKSLGSLLYFYRFFLNIAGSQVSSNELNCIWLIQMRKPELFLVFGVKISQEIQITLKATVDKYKQILTFSVQTKSQYLLELIYCGL